MTPISDQELYILSYYRASELTGGLLFGKLALHTSIDKYRSPLTQHCAEETGHAWLWTKLIHDLGHRPVKVTHTYQTEYGNLFGLPENMLEVFCLTQVFEKRVMDHFIKHRDLPHTHPKVKAVLQQMIEDETGHIGWIRKELDLYEQENGKEKLDVMMKRVEEVDEQIYNSLAQTQPFKEYFKDLL